MSARLAAVLKASRLDRAAGGMPGGVRRLLSRSLEKDGGGGSTRPQTRGSTSMKPWSHRRPPTRKPRPEPQAMKSAALKVLFVVMAALCKAAITTAILFYERPATIDARLVKLFVTPPEGTTFDVVTVSPDGRWLAFTALDASGKLKLWVRPLELG